MYPKIEKVDQKIKIRDAKLNDTYPEMYKMR